MNHEVRKRVVREFGLPDVAVEVLRHAPKDISEDFPGSQESLLFTQYNEEVGSLVYKIFEVSIVITEILLM